MGFLDFLFGTRNKDSDSLMFQELQAQVKSLCEDANIRMVEVDTWYQSAYYYDVVPTQGVIFPVICSMRLYRSPHKKINKAITGAKIDSYKSYAIWMHELGHAYSNQTPVVEKFEEYRLYKDVRYLANKNQILFHELEAWMWARENALVWTQGMNDIMAWALNTYLERPESLYDPNVRYVGFSDPQEVRDVAVRAVAKGFKLKEFSKEPETETVDA